MKMMLSLAGAALLLAACAVGGRGGAIGYYDLGASRQAAVSSAAAGVGSVEVRAPSWLESSALQYRLLYRDDHRRRSYAESRLVAPPGELVEHALRRRLVAAGARLSGCRLRVRLDEFLQVFDAPADSRAVLEARVQLLGAGGLPLAERGISISRPAPAPDAQGGVTALGAAVDELAATLAEWLAGLDRGQGAGLNISERCRST
jgi:cholesterol transport system auxiliary component